MCVCLGVSRNSTRKFSSFDLIHLYFYLEELKNTIRQQVFAWKLYFSKPFWAPGSAYPLYLFNSIFTSFFCNNIETAKNWNWNFFIFIFWKIPIKRVLSTSQFTLNICLIIYKCPVIFIEKYYQIFLSSNIKFLIKRANFL